MNNNSKSALLRKLKKEVKTLEAKVNQPMSQKIKVRCFKTCKISLKYAKLLWPFLASAVLFVAPYKLLTGVYPFVRSEEKNYLYSKEVKDNQGYYYYQEQYSDFYEGSSKMVYYSKWEFVDGEYRRNVATYDMKNISDEQIEELINSKDISLELLGNPNSIKIQRKDSIEESNEEKIEFYIYDMNENKYMLVLEGKGTAIFKGVLIIIGIVLLGAWGFKKIEENYYSINDLDNDIKEIRESGELSVEKLQELLEIKRNNYNRLARGKKDGKK